MTEESCDSDKDCWYRLFKKIFANDEENQIKYLKLCGCFSDKDWKKNLRHVVHRYINSDCETYSKVQELIRMAYFTQQVLGIYFTN